ncbi:ABC transporter permease [Dermatobacter hominis]|uniref:ABC transporter permease n=1 Tax=Dermatobacter hominis TaxID=2884263 RepID=UPI001D129B2C|nr:ABC transporter permease [Dermatobacter hominis]UDY35071.1 ABC transporter permease [Dermatobacter hominis]
MITDLARGVLQGLPPGSVYGLIAIGFVLAYKTSGVFNLAFGAQAYVSAALFFQARNEWGWSSLPAFVLAVLVVAPAIGLVLEHFIFRRLPPGSTLAKLVIAIGLSVAIPALFELVVGFEPVAGRTPEGLVAGGASVFYDPFGLYPFSRDELTAMAFAVASAAGLAALFRYTAIGLEMRAVVESPRMTELNGIRSARVSAFSWALSSTFAGLAGVLIAPRFNTLAAPDFFSLVVVAVAAAAIGKLVSLPWALIGGLALGVLISVVNTFLPDISDDTPWLNAIQENLTPAMPFVVLFGLVTLWPALRSGLDHHDPLSGVDPPPPAPAALTRSPLLTRITFAFGAAFFIVVGLAVFTQADTSWLFLVTQAVIMATIFLSITVLTGYAGLVSLGQGAFAAIGGFVVFQLADHFDVPAILAALAGALVAALVSGILAVPLVRLGAVWVAIATLAFAAFFDAVVVRLPFVGGGDTSLMEGTRVPRPIIGPWNLSDDRAFLVLALVVFGLCAYAVKQLRSGTIGRTLQALRGSEVASISIGISPTRAKVIAFALSGFLAGLGGAMLSIQQRNVNYAANFSPFAALFWIVLVVSLGARTVEGASYAGAGFSLMDRLIFSGVLVAWVLRSQELVPDVFPISPKWRYVLFGLTTLTFARHPEGLIENGKRKAHARVERWLGRRSGAPPGPTAATSPAASAAKEPVA